MPLPHFGLKEAVRVCAECERSLKAGGGQPKAAAPAARAAAPAPREEQKDAGVAVAAPPKKVRNCTCNSPLCICPPDAEEARVEESSRAAASSTQAKRQAPAGSQPAAAAPSAFMGFGGSSRPTTTYNLKGDLNEQIREAVKAQDVEGVKLLLGAGADAKYVDRTGNTLCHLAAMFNRFDILQLLGEKAASFWVKNPAGETAVDLAPPALQRKMKDMQPQPA